MLIQAKYSSSLIKMPPKTNIKREKSSTAGSSINSARSSTYAASSSAVSSINTAGPLSYSSRSSTNVASTSTFLPTRPQMAPPRRQRPLTRRPKSPTRRQMSPRRPRPLSRPQSPSSRRLIPHGSSNYFAHSSNNFARSLSNKFDEPLKSGDDYSEDSDYEDIDDDDVLTKSIDRRARGGFVEVYTDAGSKEYSCGTILSSIGVHFGHGHPDNVSRIVHSVTNNNVAEAMAVLEALKIASNNDSKKIKIYTDSQRTIDIINSPKAKAVNRLRREKKSYPRDLKGISLYYKAPEIFKKIFGHIESFEDVQMIFVKGHSKVGLFGRDGNRAADKLASEALKAAAANAGLKNKAKNNKH